MEQENQNNKASKKKKYILLGIAGGTLVLAGVGVWYFFIREGKGAKVADPNNDLFREAEKQTKQLTDKTKNAAPKKTTLTTPNQSTEPTSAVKFPIIKGRKGGLVMTMQSALIKFYGAKIKADGDYGSKTEAALIRAGFNPLVDEATYMQIIRGQAKPQNNSANSSPTDSIKALSTSEVITLASSLKTQLIKQDFWGFVGELKKAKGKENFKALNEAFKAQDYFGQFRDISVAAFNTFWDAQQQAYLIIYFNQLGLKSNDGNKYTVAGFFKDKQTVTSIVPCNVFLNDGTIMKIPANTSIGIFIERENGILKLKGIDGKHYFIHAKDTDYV